MHCADELGLLHAYTEAGLNVAVTPAGRDGALNVMLPAKPVVVDIDIPALPELPGCTVIELGEAEIAKSGLAAGVVE